MTRLVLGACLALLPALGGCSDPRDPGGQTGDRQGASCPAPVVTDLGIPFRGARTAFFRTSGGELRIGVSGLGDSLFGAVTQTGVDIGPGRHAPEVDRASNRVRGAIRSVTVHEDRPTSVDLPAGSYWLVSSNGGRIELRTCPGVTVSEVGPADGDPGAAFSSGVSSG